MFPMRRAFLAVLFLFLGVSTLPAATFDRPVTDARLIERADLVVIATVEGEVSRTADGAIVTDYRFRVERVLRGTVSSDLVTVTELGGAVDNLMMIVSGAPAYQPGSRVLAFLRARGDGTYFTAYMSAGALRFVREGGKDMLVRTNDGDFATFFARDVIDFVLGKTANAPIPAPVSHERFDPETNALASSYTTTADPPGAPPRRPVRWPCDGTPLCNLSFVVNDAQDGVADTLSGVEAALGAWDSAAPYLVLRSEERRVGKECRSWWWPCH